MLDQGHKIRTAYFESPGVNRVVLNEILLSDIFL